MNIWVDEQEREEGKGPETLPSFYRRDTSYFLQSLPAILVALESPKDGWSIRMEVIRLCLTSSAFVADVTVVITWSFGIRLGGGKIKITDVNFFLLWLSVGGDSGKEPTCQCRRHKRCGCNPWVRKIPWRRKWQPTSLFLPGEFHGQRSLTGYNPWGCKESDTTEAT